MRSPENCYLGTSNLYILCMNDSRHNINDNCMVDRMIQRSFVLIDRYTSMARGSVNSKDNNRIVISK